VKSWIHFVVLSGLLLFGCTPEQEGTTPTAGVATLVGTPVVVLTDTVAVPTQTETVTPTLEATATDTPVPATEAATVEGEATGTIQPTDTPAEIVPFTEGQIAFFWDPDPYPVDEPHPPSTHNLYLARPGATPENWQIETVLTDAVIEAQAIFPSPDKSKVALLLWDDTNGDGNLDIHLRTDGRNIFIFNLADYTISQLTNNQVAMFSLSWSPDSESISYPQNGEIFEVNLGGAFPQVLLNISTVCTDSCSVDRLAWSPDGRILAMYVRDEQWPYLLYFFNREISQTVLISDQIGYRAEVQWWSPDNQWLAFTQGGYPDLVGDLFVVDTETLAITELAKLGRLASDNEIDVFGVPTWSPDSQWLAYTRYQTTLSLWNPNTLSVTEVFSATQVGAPVWSPEGFTLAVGIVQDGQAKLALVQAADGQVQELFQTAEAQRIEALGWSPDGQWLVFFAEQAEQSGLYVINRAGGEAHLVMDTTGGDMPYSLVWLPVGEDD
jgi:Tol biopolymer transport system component